MKTSFPLAIMAIITMSATPLTSCQKSTGTKAQDKDSTQISAARNVGIYKEYQYEFYRNQNVTEGMYYCGIAKDVYKDGKVEYKPYMNFISNYNNHYSGDCLILSENDLPLMLEFLDSCSAYKPLTDSDVSLNVRCQVGGDNGADLCYDEDGLGIYFAVNQYRCSLSIKDFRNIISGLKIKLEGLKKEDEKK